MGDNILNSKKHFLAIDIVKLLGSEEGQNPTVNAAVLRVVKYMTSKTSFCKY